jgi:outer membrane lipoprotein-sorting protein
LIPRHRILALAAGVLLAMAAQSQAQSRTAAKPSPTDAELENAIRQRFSKSKSAADKFTVRVQGGVATIEGKTDVVQRKSAATRMAKSAGAKKVVNNIQVSEAARQGTSKNLTSGRRRAQVKRSEVER